MSHPKEPEDILVEPPTFPSTIFNLSGPYENGIPAGKIVVF
jgi:hypothetical protein